MKLFGEITGYDKQHEKLIIKHKAVSMTSAVSGEAIVQQTF